MKVKKIIDNIKHYSVQIYYKLDKDPVWVMSSAIAFDIIICIIPLLLLFLTIIGIYLNSTDSINRISSFLFTNMPFEPAYREKLVYELINRTKELTANTLLSGIIGGAALIWTVSVLFGTIRTVLNTVFKVEETASFFYGKLKDLLMVFIIVALFIISFAITSTFQLITDYQFQLFGVDLSLNTFQSIITFFIASVSSFIMFYILYAFVPHWRISSRKVALISSIISTILFELLKFLFTIYLVKFADYQKFYGAYASLAITLIWIYYISVIFVIGAEFGEIYRERTKYKVISKKKKDVKVKEYGTEAAV